MGRLYYPAARAILQVVFDGFGSDDADSDPLVIPVLPKAVTVHRNSYRQADSWELVCDANDLPIDPQMVRAGTAELYLFELSELGEPRIMTQQFAGADDPADALGRSTGSAVEVEQGGARARDRFTFGHKPMVVGLFDEQTIEMSSSGKWITIQGQDYTALLAAKQWPPTSRGTARRIPTGTRLDVWLADILAEADPQKKLAVTVEGVEATSLPVVGSKETSTNKRGIPIEQDTSYWDVIYKVVTRYGLITFVRGLDVVIARPKNIENLATHDVKTLAWGKNLEHLTLSRKLGKEKAPRVIVQGYDQDTQKTITVEYPDTSLKKGGPVNLRPKANTSTTIREGAPKAATSTAKQKTLEDEYTYIPTFGVSDRVTLQRMAENYHRLRGRAERTIVARTRDLKDLDGSSLMDLTTGDAVDLEFTDFNREIIANNDVPESAKYEHLLARGYSPPVAQVVAKHYTKLLGIKRPFRVREVTYEYDADTGLSIEAELIDFIVIDGTR